MIHPISRRDMLAATGTGLGLLGLAMMSEEARVVVGDDLAAPEIVIVEDDQARHVRWP